MPTYEYRCRDCGQHVEVVQSFRDDALTECGSCGGRLRKVFAAAGIIFKGSGYYVNDSRKAAAAKAGEQGDKGDKGDKATGSETKEPAAEQGNAEQGKAGKGRAGTGKTDGAKAPSVPGGGSTSAPAAESA